MTEPVVKKLQNNTNKLLELKCKTISQTFGINSNDIMSYLTDAKEATGNGWKKQVNWMVKVRNFHKIIAI